ncbi:MAG: NAD-dependent succinate-semialdehyde dehydrogenase [Bdellovibrionota bacterium]
MEKQAKITTVNPETGSPLREYPTHTSAELDSIFRDSRAAFLSWRNIPLVERARALRKLSELLLEEKKQLAELMSAEMGKLLPEALAEVEKCAACAKYYAENGAALLAPIETPTEAHHSFVCFEPLGTVLAIMPWNFPLWQAVRCAAPAITAGNSVVLKHASNVTGSALALERLFRAATGRDHLFRAVVVPGSQALALIARPEVRAVSLTGSTDVGRQVAAAAGKELKKCVLELGGSDAYVILKDADIPKAAKICAQSRLINAGQSCIAAKRFGVESAVFSWVTDEFLKELQSKPLAPLARGDLREQLHEQVSRAVRQGARVLCGGAIPGGPGFFYPATVLTGVKPGNPAFDEELFGPVAALIEAEDESEALKFANQSEFGLGAAVFTRDLTKAERIARNELEAGSCFGNALVRSDSRLPFGGIKASGYGRELAGFGVREFTNVKTVFIDS